MAIDASRVIFTFTCTQWFNMPSAMIKMAETIHPEGVPINWQINLETAREQRQVLTDFHETYGDEILTIGTPENLKEWQELFPWSKFKIVGGARTSTEDYKKRLELGFQGVWGFCDQQVGVDGITHWGCPWGMFYISPKTCFTPSQQEEGLVGIPWTLRDLHKVYHLRQPINFCIDPIEMIRSKTLDYGENISYFQDILDELIANTAWNERVYCCIHEEADGPFIFPGCNFSNEGANPEESEAMYKMMAAWVRYAKSQGVTVMTLPEAVSDYKNIAGKKSLSSTLLTRDKTHGSVRHYIAPLPPGIKAGDMGSAGHFPDTLFHYDDECQLVFVHPDPMPKLVLDYTKEYIPDYNRPYPSEQNLPILFDWKTKRNDSERIYEWTVQSYYAIPSGIAEWGNFQNWKVEETNGQYAKIIDNRVLFVRIDLLEQTGSPEIVNREAKEGRKYWVRLKRK